MSFALLSWPTVYCVSVTLVQLYLALYTVRWKLRLLQLWTSFEVTMGTIMSFNILVSVAHPLFFTWRETPHLVAAINQWDSLKVFYDSVVKKPISSAVLSHPRRCLLVTILYAVIVMYLPILIFLKYWDINVITIYILTIHYLTLIGWFWVVIALLVSRTAELLKESLIQGMRGDYSAGTLYRHRLLWQELQSCTVELTDAVGGSLWAWQLLTRITLVLSVYNMAAFVVTRGTMPLNNLGPALHTATHLFLLHNSSYLADRNMERDLTVAILSCNFNDFSEDQFNEAELFLSAIENSVQRFVLKATAGFSRTSVLNVVETTLTILVILVQFKAFM